MIITEEKVADTKSAFGKYEEKVIVSLILDQPELATVLLPYLSEDLFDVPECKYTVAQIKWHVDKYSVIPTRPMLHDIVINDLTADDQYHKEIVDLVTKKSDPRDIKIISDKVVEWAKKKQYGKLYSEEAIEAQQRGEYEYIEKLFDDARKIIDFKAKFMFFFKEYQALFEEKTVKHLTTGFPSLDQTIGGGGPTKKECFCWLAPTGVGKSIALVNSGVGNLKMGQNVLHVTLEMPAEKIALRYLGCLTDKWISLRHKNDVRAAMTDRLQKVKSTYGSELIIAEHAPGEITVDTIRMHIDVLRRVHGINIDVVIVDYLELLKPREKRRDDNDYSVQKDISTDLCNLAKNENVLVFSAFQTNREGNDNLNTSSDDKVIDINKVAESYGKTFSVDYLVTINQNKSEYEEGKKDGFNVNAVCRFWVAKNRGGEKFVMIYGRINYMTMKITEDHTDHS